jgi:hypothetical protein
MTSFKNHISVIGLASALVLPLSGQAQNDWVIEKVGDLEITNTTNGNTVPFTIEDKAPADIFYISKEGNLGLGDAPPVGEFSPRLYISDPTPEIELDDLDQIQTWQLFANGGDGSLDLGGIGFFDVTGDELPFYIESATPTASLLVRSSGYVGVGIANPEAKVHVSGDSANEDDVQVLVQNFNTATPGVAKKLFVIKNDGPAKFSVSIE